MQYKDILSLLFGLAWLILAIVSYAKTPIFRCSFLCGHWARIHRYGILANEKDGPR